MDFLKKQAKRIGLPFAEFGSSQHPIVVITWEGKDSSLPSIMLNSHMDVVPVYRVGTLTDIYISVDLDSTHKKHIKNTIFGYTFPVYRTYRANNQAEYLAIRFLEKTIEKHISLSPYHT